MIFGHCLQCVHLSQTVGCCHLFLYWALMMSRGFHSLCQDYASNISSRCDRLLVVVFYIWQKCCLGFFFNNLRHDDPSNFSSRYDRLLLLVVIISVGICVRGNDNQYTILKRPTHNSQISCNDFFILSKK